MYSNKLVLNTNILHSTDITFTGSKEVSSTTVEKYDGTRKVNNDILTVLTCHTDADKYLSSDLTFVIRWYKDDDTDNVEAKYNNTWTFYTSDKTQTEYKIWFDYKTYGYEKVINEYDLVLFTLQSNQAGTYRCKAVSLSDPNKHVTLSERTVTFASGSFLGYIMYLTVEYTGIQRSITLYYQYRCTRL